MEGGQDREGRREVEENPGHHQRCHAPLTQQSLLQAKGASCGMHAWPAGRAPHDDSALQRSRWKLEEEHHPWEGHSTGSGTC
eukprot:1764574-Pyramimonas_sp.AAC.1